MNVTPHGAEAVYRRMIVHLVKALAEIPGELRWKWRTEISEKPNDQQTPDELLVMLVLNNLPCAERLADRARERDGARVLRLGIVK